MTIDQILTEDNTGRVRYTDHIGGSGECLFKKIEGLNLEGMAMKRKDSHTLLPWCRDWLKVRTTSGGVTLQKRIENWK